MKVFDETDSLLANNRQILTPSHLNLKYSVIDVWLPVNDYQTSGSLIVVSGTVYYEDGGLANLVPVRIKNLNQNDLIICLPRKKRGVIMDLESHRYEELQTLQRIGEE